MKIDCISDLHGEFPKLDGGDLLIVAGDLTSNDTPKQLIQFLEWIESQKYDRLIFIGGNHDNLLQEWCTTEQSDNMMSYDEFHKWEYICDSGTEFEGLKIWGSPWTKTFLGINPHCKAFTKDTDEELNEKWKLIPDDIDILITHSPPHGIFDTIYNRPFRKNPIPFEAGSVSLRNHVMGRINPKLHVFGHIHQWGGRMLDTCTTKFVNASLMNNDYEFVNDPVTVIL